MNPSSSPARRLDMKHGFIKSIVKNQISRDEYHKAMEERRESYLRKPDEAEERPPPRKPLPPIETRLYIPPHLRSSMKNPSGGFNKRRSLQNGFLSQDEESRIRAKVRSEVRPLPEIVGGSSSDGPGGQKESTRALFILHLTMKGEEAEVTVLSTDNAARLAKALGRQYELSETECRLLRQTLEGELEARLSPPVSQ